MSCYDAPPGVGNDGKLTDWCRNGRLKLPSVARLLLDLGNMPCRFQQHDTRCCSPSCWVKLHQPWHHWASLSIQMLMFPGSQRQRAFCRSESVPGQDSPWAVVKIMESWNRFRKSVFAESLVPNTSEYRKPNFTKLNTKLNIQLKKATKRLLTCVLVENQESEESESNKILYCHKGWESSWVF